MRLPRKPSAALGPATDPHRRCHVKQRLIVPDWWLCSAGCFGRSVGPAAESVGPVVKSTGPSLKSVGPAPLKPPIRDDQAKGNQNAVASSILADCQAPWAVETTEHDSCDSYVASSWHTKHQRTRLPSFVKNTESSGNVPVPAKIKASAKWPVQCLVSNGLQEIGSCKACMLRLFTNHWQTERSSQIDRGSVPTEIKQALHTSKMKCSSEATATSCPKDHKILLNDSIPN